MSTKDTLLACTKNEQTLSIEELNALYDTLPATSCNSMLGQWRGKCLNTGHPGEAKLAAIGWAGKEFRSTNDVMPIMSEGEDGALTVNPIMGTASLRMVEYRGAVTATMVYDQHPIFDHFKCVDDTMVLGVMDAKSEELPLYFLLERVPA